MLAGSQISQEALGCGFKEFVYVGTSVHIIFTFISVTWILLFAKNPVKTDCQN
jgi:hypothetical protein